MTAPHLYVTISLLDCDRALGHTIAIMELQLDANPTPLRRYHFEV